MPRAMKLQRGGGGITLPLEYFGKTTNAYSSGNANDSYNTAYGTRSVGSENNNSVYKQGEDYFFGSNLGPGGSTVSSSGVMTGGYSAAGTTDDNENIEDILASGGSAAMRRRTKMTRRTRTRKAKKQGKKASGKKGKKSSAKKGKKASK